MTDSALDVCGLAVAAWIPIFNIAFNFAPFAVVTSDGGAPLEASSCVHAKSSYNEKLSSANGRYPLPLTVPHKLWI